MAKIPKLTRVTRLDAIPLEKAHYTDEGYLVDNPIVTSCGIFEYHNPDGSVRKELRLPEHVFDEKSLATYKGKPVIITHDAGRVTKDNVAENSIGTILTEGKPDGDNVRAEIVIHDTDELKQLRLKELSLGYDLTLDETPGEWNGQQYDAIQTEIVINHLAIVREARAGEQARLNIDSRTINLRKGANQMAKTAGKTKTPARGKKVTDGRRPMNTDEYKASIAAFEKRRKKRLDEAEEEAKIEEAAMENANSDEDENEDEESAVVEEINENSDTPTLEDKINLIKDRRDRRDADGDTDDPEAAKGIIAHQDEDIETLLEIVEELQAKNDFAQQDEGDDDPDKKDCDVLTEGGGGGPEIIIKTDSREAIKREIKERVNLGLVGRTLKLDGLEEKTPLEAKKAIIKKLRPRLNLDGKGAVYIDVAYEQAIEELRTPKDTNYQRGQVFNADSRGRSQTSGASKSQKARENMLKRMQNGGNE